MQPTPCRATNTNSAFYHKTNVCSSLISGFAASLGLFALSVAPTRADDTKPLPTRQTALIPAMDAAQTERQAELEDALKILNQPVETAKPIAAKKRAQGEFDVNTILPRRHYYTTPGVCQIPDVVRSPVAIGLRLGAAVSPRVKFAGGVDVTIPGLSLARGFSTRVDFDAIVAANYHGISTLFPLTFDQIYRVSLPGGAGIYVGGGIGPYFGEVTRFGGKLLIGGSITRRVGLEGTVHFQGIGDSIATVQARTTF